MVNLCPGKQCWALSISMSNRRGLLTRTILCITKKKININIPYKTKKNHQSQTMTNLFSSPSSNFTLTSPYIGGKQRINGINIHYTIQHTDSAQKKEGGEWIYMYIVLRGNQLIPNIPRPIYTRDSELQWIKAFLGLLTNSDHHTKHQDSYYIYISYILLLRQWWTISVGFGMHSIAHYYSYKINMIKYMYGKISMQK